MLWYFGVFKKYATFSGRARRRELWWAFLFQILAMSVIVVLFVLTLNNTANAEKAIYNLMGIVNLATALPMLAVQARRLHDTNKSAWWVLLQFLPVVNIVYFVWLATDGDRGENRFGQDPKEESRRHLS
ncbi:MAG: DUF805 domain-containing protein [Kiritimatiellae bacterium]|nr:DUF805 domain-containing protein [Kiritimatiellia bacterium]